MKPIIVCGVDFSGTSMLAGLLHAAGVDMGDVESAEDVAASERPIRYRIFEDRALPISYLARRLLKDIPYIQDGWLFHLKGLFRDYANYREKAAQGRRWGVKCNGLLFLAMCDDFDMDSVQWLTTYRPLEDSMDSCFDKLGISTQYAAMLAAEYVAWKRLIERQGPPEFAFDDLIYQSQQEAWRLAKKLGYERIDAMSVINPYTKGIIPCHGSSPPPPLVAP